MGGFNTGSSRSSNVAVGVNSSFGESGGESSVVFEPTAQRLNRLLIAQIEGLMGSILNQQSPLGPPPTAPTKPPKGATKDEMRAYQASVKQYKSELASYNKEAKARAKLTQSPEQRGGLVPFANFNPNALPSAEELGFLANIKNLANEPRVSPLEQKGVDALLAAMDPTQRLAEAKSAFDTVGVPQIINQLTAAGMGRSGAIGESLAKGATDYTLPILADVNNARLVGGNQLLNYGQAAEQRYAGRQLSALDAARLPREALFNEQMRPAQLLGSLMGGLPAGVGSGTNSSTWSTQLATGLNLGSGTSKANQFGLNVGKG